jgi:hypothetical protein
MSQLDPHKNPHQSAWGSPVSNEAWLLGVGVSKNTSSLMEFWLWHTFIFRWVVKEIQSQRAWGYARGWDDAKKALRISLKNRP